jgi:hypothetical protein
MTEPIETPIEAPEDDVAEQSTPARPDAYDDAPAADDDDGPLEADPADRADQQRTVELGDDEYE